MDPCIEERNPKMNPATNSEPDAVVKLKPLWERAGLSPVYPATVDQAVMILRAGEYEVTTQTVVDYVQNGYIQPPPRVAGRMVWSAEAIEGFRQSLESRRMWAKGSLLHMWKKTAFERDLEIAELNGNNERIEELADRWQLADLLRMIPEADRLESRQALYVALLHKLRSMLPCPA